MLSKSIHKRDAATAATTNPTADDAPPIMIAAFSTPFWPRPIVPDGIGGSSLKVAEIFWVGTMSVMIDCEQICVGQVFELLRHHNLETWRSKARR